MTQLPIAQPVYQVLLAPLVINVQLVNRELIVHLHQLVKMEEVSIYMIQQLWEVHVHVQQIMLDNSVNYALLDMPVQPVLLPIA